MCENNLHGETVFVGIQNDLYCGRRTVDFDLPATQNSVVERGVTSFQWSCTLEAPAEAFSIYSITSYQAQSDWFVQPAKASSSGGMTFLVPSSYRFLKVARSNMASISDTVAYVSEATPTKRTAPIFAGFESI